MVIYSCGLRTDTKTTCQQDLEGTNLCATVWNIRLQFHIFVVLLSRPVDGWRPGFVGNMRIRVMCAALTAMAGWNGTGFSPIRTAVDPLFPQEARW